MSRIYGCGNTCFLRRKFDGNVKKKLYDSAENAATDTRVNVMYPLTETCRCRHVSATVLRVYVCFHLRILEISLFTRREATLSMQKQSRTSVKCGRIEGVTGRYLRCSQYHPSWYCLKLCQQEHFGGIIRYFVKQ